MEKAALEVLSQGLKYPDRGTAVVCGNALMVLKGRAPGKVPFKKKIQAGRFEIKQIPAKSRGSKTRQKVDRKKK